MYLFSFRKTAELAVNLQCFGKRNKRATGGLQPHFTLLVYKCAHHTQKTRTEKWNAARVFILKHETTEQQKEASHYHVTLPLEPTGISVTCAAL